MTIRGDTTQLDEYIARLDRFFKSELISKTVGLLRKVGDATQEALEEYPPETEANRPPPPYYQRGLGTVTRNFVIPESQQLGENWEQQTLVGQNEVEHHIRNEVTYAAYVHGQQLQAGFHARRGWPIAIDVAESVVGEEGGLGVVHAGVRNVDLEREVDEILVEVK